MIKLFKNLKLKEWIFIFISIVFIVIQVWLNLKIPDYMKKITTLVQTPGSQMSKVWEAGGFMLLCAFGSAASAVIVGYFASLVAASFSRRLREKVFSKVVSFSTEEISNFSTASLMTRTTNDITQVQMIIAMGMQLIIYAPIMAAWAITKISNKSWQWSLSTGIAVFLLLIIITILISLVLPKFKKVQELTDNLNKVTRENLTGLRIVRAYNAENYEEEKFEVANEELTKTNLFTSRTMSVMNPAMSAIMSGLTLSIYWVGAFIINSTMTIDRINIFGDMVIFSHYAVQVVMSFMMLTMIFIMFPRASVSARRINEVLGTTSSINEGKYQDEDENKTKKIELRNVYFMYPNASEYVLQDINLTIQQGETVAFIGSTGSGKSTLINLIPRFYDVTKGELLIDGVNIKEYNFNTLNNKLGYVPQKPVLFSGTIRSNVAYGESKEPISDEDIIRALKIAQGFDFVMQMDQQLDANVSQAGTNLSGGQKQRIAIARAIAKKPEILIFDDSFSALDFKTDQQLRVRLRNETQKITKLIVAQRIGTILDADKIVVLESGKVVGIGTHQELLKTCEVYKEIAYSQLSEEELHNE